MYKIPFVEVDVKVFNKKLQEVVKRQNKELEEPEYISIGKIGAVVFRFVGHWLAFIDTLSEMINEEVKNSEALIENMMNFSFYLVKLSDAIQEKKVKKDGIVFSNIYQVLGVIKDSSLVHKIMRSYFEIKEAN